MTFREYIHCKAHSIFWHNWFLGTFGDSGSRKIRIGFWNWVYLKTI